MTSNRDVKDFQDLAGLIGDDMHRIKRDICTLNENQKLLLEEIKLIRVELVGRWKSIDGETT